MDLVFSLGGRVTPGARAKLTGAEQNAGTEQELRGFVFMRLDILIIRRRIIATPFRAVRATVRFAPFQRTGAGRKQLALQLREEILKLKTECVH